MDLIYRYDPKSEVPIDPVSDAQSAMEMLKSGNDRFVEIVSSLQERAQGGPSESIVYPIHPVSLGIPLAPGAKLSQTPFALVVGCSDARVNIETIFQQWMNGMFVIRIAGNVLGTECLGSIDYAVAHLGESLRLVLVLGHSDCGAVTAAVDSYLTPQIFGEIAFSHPLRSLLDRIHIAVRMASKTLQMKFGEEVGQKPGFRSALIEMSVYLNAAVTAFDLSREISTIKKDGLKTVFTVYDFASMKVSSRPESQDVAPRESPFCPAPSTPEDLKVLASSIADSVGARHLGIHVS